jgi:hypothetical protein
VNGFNALAPIQEPVFGRLLTAFPILALSRRSALFSAQAVLVYIVALALVYLAVLGLGSPRGLGCGEFLSPCRPDCLSVTGQLVRRSDVGDCAVQQDRVVIGHELGDEPSSVFQAQRGLTRLQPVLRVLDDRSIFPSREHNINILVYLLIYRFVLIL